ncbi:MAG: fluoride efflux transporter CrcB [Synergistes sp.]|nr:fluoride efflux transporter CrcB [Synergistes sp.]
MLNCLFVGVGGFIGSVLRYLVGLILVKCGSFPIGTFAVNIAGAFAIGFIAAYSMKNTSVDPHLLLMAKVGICGGFTTFSTFSLETLTIVRSGNIGTAVLYVVASIVACVAAVLCGQLAAR